jgi:hypothetical protein
MAQSLHLLEQAERRRRLARKFADANARDRFIELADRYAAEGGRTTKALPEVSKIGAGCGD